MLLRMKTRRSWGRVLFQCLLTTYISIVDCIYPLAWHVEQDMSQWIFR